MKLYPRETVIFAVDFNKMVNWYQNVLGFQITALHEEDYRYCNMKNETGILIGIADSQDLAVKSYDRKNNTVILQVQVSNVNEFFKFLSQKEGKISFGPSYDKNGGFWYGGFEDIEGNPWWVVDENCP